MKCLKLPELAKHPKVFTNLDFSVNIEYDWPLGLLTITLYKNNNKGKPDLIHYIEIEAYEKIDLRSQKTTNFDFLKDFHD